MSEEMDVTIEHLCALHRARGFWDDGEGRIGIRDRAMAEYVWYSLHDGRFRMTGSTSHRGEWTTYHAITRRGRGRKK